MRLEMLSPCKVATGQTLIGQTVELDASSIRGVGCEYAALGHIHMRQDWLNGSVAYCGSPRRCNYGEPEDKGFLVATFEGEPGEALLSDLELRINAVLDARRCRYVMLHLLKERLGEVQRLCAGLESPTILPLAGREDLVAIHFVVSADQLWAQLAELRRLGATGIVAIRPEALV